MQAWITRPRQTARIPPHHPTTSGPPGRRGCWTQAAAAVASRGVGCRARPGASTLGLWPGQAPACPRPASQATRARRRPKVGAQPAAPVCVAGGVQHRQPFTVHVLNHLTHEPWRRRSQARRQAAPSRRGAMARPSRAAASTPSRQAQGLPARRRTPTAPRCPQGWPPRCSICRWPAARRGLPRPSSSRSRSSTRRRLGSSSSRGRRWERRRPAPRE